MPHLIETESRTDTVVEAINYLLASGGPPALSIRAIARESRVSGSSLLHHYGSREHLIRVAAHRTARARLRRIEARAWTQGALAFLPGDADDVVDARSWLAWCELWRSEESLTTTLGHARLDERALLARTLDFTFHSNALAELIALIDGLLVAVCAPVRPMSPARARSILAVRAGPSLPAT